MTTETVTLGHVNLTIPPRNTDDDAWRARIEARREENRRRIQLAQAAKNPPKRPVVAPVDTRTCPQCGTVFTVPTSHPTKTYCSTQCRGKAGKAAQKRAKAVPARPCDECGERFTPRRNNPTQRFCCATCRRRDYNRAHPVERKPRQIVITPCPGCKRPTRDRNVNLLEAPGTVPRHRAGMCKPCCRAVDGAANTRKCKCKQCGKVFNRAPSERREVCSDECGRAWKRAVRLRAAGQEAAA